MTYRPKRTAPPRLIFDAASALAGQVEASAQIGDDDRDRWYNAITKASGQLMDGVRFDIAGDELIFPSRSRDGVSHRTNGACTCEAYTSHSASRDSHRSCGGRWECRGMLRARGENHRHH
jgi:hypothetical protein